MRVRVRIGNTVKVRVGVGEGSDGVRRGVGGGSVRYRVYERGGTVPPLQYALHAWKGMVGYRRRSRTVDKRSGL